MISKPQEPLLRELEIGNHSSQWLRICSVLWKRRWLWLRGVIGSASLSLVVAFVWPPSYTSTVQLMPPESSSINPSAAMVTELSANPMVGRYAEQFLGVKNSAGLLIGILRSRTLQDGVISKFDLRSAYWKRYYADARIELNRNTVITEDKKSGIITLAVTDRDRNRAAAIARDYVTRLDVMVAALATSSARRERQFLEVRLEEVKRNLDNYARELGEFSSQNATFKADDQLRVMLDAGARLQAELMNATSELSELKVVYTSSNPRVRALEARIAELDRQLKRLGGTANSTRDNSLLYPSLKQLPALSIRYADLYRRTKVQELLFEALTKQYEFAKVQEAKDIPSVRILDEPDLPEKKSWPPRTLIVMAGILFGIGVSTLVTLWRLGPEVTSFASWEDLARSAILDLRRNPHTHLTSDAGR
jgi:uncharacterized protein involved in exopolysaccharide biosynthesis